MRWVASTGTPFLQSTGRNKIHPILAKYGSRPKSTASSRQKQKQRQHTPQKPAALFQKPLIPKQGPIVSTNASQETPLVQRRQKPLPLPIPGLTTGPSSKSKYEPEQKSSGIYAPRVRLAVGVILIGSIIYSMVALLIFFLTPS